ncbi:hypothetical protein [Hyphobacterium indicum]|uniref:hypothetical protein n=1 Tax=Hyphobacterium indicum TaxID=2162714 RepID=UPI000D645FFC|nr:hypothetical protein [Hyphobacterium indicum]
MVSIRDTFDERLEEFRAEYEFNPQDEVIRSLSVIGEMLDLVFIGDEAGMTMAVLEKVIAKGRREGWDWAELASVQPDENWRETWSKIDGWDASSTPPFLDELHDLSAFAKYGIVTLWDIEPGAVDMASTENHIRHRIDQVKNLPKWVQGVCAKIDQFERLALRNEGGKTELFHLTHVRDHARARIKYDAGETLTVGELAILSGVSTKRLQNAIYARSEGAPTVSKSGLISTDACKRWLEDRDYKASIWKDVIALYPLHPNWGRNTEYQPDQELLEHDDYLFVPVDKDGSIFHPGLKRGLGGESVFRIGPKGGEDVVANFDEALSRLSRMQTPRWRRPNKDSGNWGIVSGQSWKRIRRSELEALSDD